MTYNNLVSRSEAGALMPEEYTKPLIGNLPQQSAAIKLFRNVRMARAQMRMPVLSALPIAYFVNGDTGLKQTTEMAWSNKYLNVEELAAIVPIPESVLDDSEYDMWAEIQPRVEEAIGRAVDAAVFFGTNKPTSWPTEIVTAAIAAGNVIDRGTNDAAHGSIAGDISDTYATVEADGYDVTGSLAVRSYRGRIRNARSTYGEQLSEVSALAAYDIPIEYPMRGLWPSGSHAAEFITGDFANEGVIGIRQDMDMKLLSESVIQDNTGAIVYNLAQQDMVALRVKFRVAWQISNVVNFDQPVEANRYPWAVLRAPA